MDGLTLITPTRNRDHCFSLLESYISRQTYTGFVQWIVVVDEGWEKYNFTQGQWVYKRDPKKDNPGLHSICANYLLASRQVTQDKIVIAEDDEVYRADYLERMSAELDRADLVGFVPAYYYNLMHHQYRIMPNREHASLAQTGFTRAVLPTFEQGCRLNDPFIDMWLWTHWRNEGGSYALLPNDEQIPPLCVSMKGLWGEKGCGSGHAPKLGPFDTGLRVLKEWLGDDWKHYE